jgi:hypothetical protein
MFWTFLKDLLFIVLCLSLLIPPHVLEYIFFNVIFRNINPLAFHIIALDLLLRAHFVMYVAVRVIIHVVGDLILQGLASRTIMFFVYTTAYLYTSLTFLLPLFSYWFEQCLSFNVGDFFNVVYDFFLVFFSCLGEYLTPRHVYNYYGPQNDFALSVQNFLQRNCNFRGIDMPDVTVGYWNSYYPPHEYNYWGVQAHRGWHVCYVFKGFSGFR